MHSSCGPHRPAALAAAAVLLQLVLGVGTHAAALGCLPGVSSMLALPAGAAALALVPRLLRGHRRAVQLAGGQLALHLLLSTLAACGEPAAAGSAHDGIPLRELQSAAAMLALHVLAIAACMVLHDRAQRAAAQAADVALQALAALAGPLGRATSAGPVHLRAAPLPAPLAADARPFVPVLLVEGTRGPPVAARPRTPAPLPHPLPRSPADRTL